MSTKIHFLQHPHHRLNWSLQRHGIHSTHPTNMLGTKFVSQYFGAEEISSHIASTWILTNYGPFRGLWIQFSISTIKLPLTEKLTSRPCVLWPLRFSAGRARGNSYLFTSFKMTSCLHRGRIYCKRCLKYLPFPSFFPDDYLNSFPIAYTPEIEHTFSTTWFILSPGMFFQGVKFVG